MISFFPSHMDALSQEMFGAEGTRKPAENELEDEDEGHWKTRKRVAKPQKWKNRLENQLETFEKPQTKCW